ncbi:MAG: type II CAAX prenyl endopeptidase Rce1 family protein [Chloroflexota bacterium]
MRLDRALLNDARTVFRSRPLLFFFALELLAGGVFVMRRGEQTATTVLLIWLGMLILAFFAWWAGRHRLAHPQPDPVPGATARAVFALIGVAGMMLFGLSMAVGFVLITSGIGGWLWAAWRGGGLAGLRERLLRDPRPFVPLFLLIGLPRLLIGGPAYLVGAAVALPSGIGQQVLFLLGLFVPLEALRQRSDVAAVLAALLFALLHVPFVIEANDGDLLASLANVVLFQASVGLIACLAFVRHRAAAPIGVAHALAIG